MAPAGAAAVREGGNARLRNCVSLLRRGLLLTRVRRRSSPAFHRDHTRRRDGDRLCQGGNALADSPERAACLRGSYVHWLTTPSERSGPAERRALLIRRLLSGGSDQRECEEHVTLRATPPTRTSTTCLRRRQWWLRPARPGRLLVLPALLPCVAISQPSRSSTSRSRP